MRAVAAVVAAMAVAAGVAEAAAWEELAVVAALVVVAVVAMDEAETVEAVATWAMVPARARPQRDVCGPYFARYCKQ